MHRAANLACLLLAGAAATSTAASGDWPGWRGLDRTGVSTETGLLQQWPPAGPPLCWKASGLGGGYSTPSVAGGRVFLMGSHGSDEFVHALDARDGRLLWSTRVGLVGKNTGPEYPGPRSTPTVDSDRLYTLGSDGDLVCLETATGKLVWHRHLVKDFQGKRGTWAYAESPLLDGDTLVCTPGGDSATMVALDKHNGAVRWRAVKPEYNVAGYASAIVAQVGNVRQYVQFLGPGLIGVAARDGRLLWTYRGHIGGVSCDTPIFHDGCIFSSTSGFEEGAGGDVLLRLTADGDTVHARPVYLIHTLKNMHGGVVRVGNFLYGTSTSALLCLEFRTGRLCWKARSVGTGSLMAADGCLYVRGVEGQVALVEATSAGYHERGRFRQPFRSRYATFCHPVVAGGRLYLRDADVLLCYDIQAP